MKNSLNKIALRLHDMHSDFTVNCHLSTWRIRFLCIGKTKGIVEERISDMNRRAIEQIRSENDKK